MAHDVSEYLSFVSKAKVPTARQEVAHGLDFLGPVLLVTKSTRWNLSLVYSVFCRLLEGFNGFYQVFRRVLIGF